MTTTLDSLDDLKDKEDRVQFDPVIEIDSLRNKEWVPKEYINLLEYREEIEEIINDICEEISKEKIDEHSNKFWLKTDKSDYKLLIKQKQSNSTDIYTILKSISPRSRGDDLYLGSDYTSYSDEYIKMVGNFFKDLQKSSSQNLPVDDFDEKNKKIVSLCKKAVPELKSVRNKSDFSLSKKAIEENLLDLTALLLTKTYKYINDDESEININLGSRAEKNIIRKAMTYWKETDGSKEMCKAYTDVKYQDENHLAFSGYTKYFSDDGSINTSKKCLIAFTNSNFNSHLLRRLNPRKEYNPEYDEWDENTFKEVLGFDDIISNVSENELEEGKKYQLYKNSLIERESYDNYFGNKMDDLEKAVLLAGIKNFNRENLLIEELYYRIKDDETLSSTIRGVDEDNLSIEGLQKCYEEKGFKSNIIRSIYDVNLEGIKKGTTEKYPSIINVSTTDSDLIKEKLNDGYDKEDIDYYKHKKGYQRMTKKLRTEIYQELSEKEILNLTFKRLPAEEQCLLNGKIEKVKKNLKQKLGPIVFRYNDKASINRRSQFIEITNPDQVITKESSIEEIQECFKELEESQFDDIDDDQEILDKRMEDISFPPVDESVDDSERLNKQREFLYDYLERTEDRELGSVRESLKDVYGGEIFVIFTNARYPINNKSDTEIIVPEESKLILYDSKLDKEKEIILNSGVYNFSDMNSYTEPTHYMNSS